MKRKSEEVGRMKKSRPFSFFVILTILVYIFAIPAAAAEPPSEILEASSVLLINLETQSVVFEHFSDEEHAPSATAKLMTAIVAYEKLRDRIDGEVLITEDMTRGYTSYQSFHNGEWRCLNDYLGRKMQIRDLFELMLISGANDAAQALAVLSCKSVDEFVSEMNRKAAELGMTSTVYTNPTGASALGAKSTARDCARLACAFLNYAELSKISSSFSSRISVGGDGATIYNRNPISSNYYNTNYYDTSINGIIYGASSRTDACLIAEKREGNLAYVCVIMGADSETNLRDENGKIRNAFTLCSSLLDYGVDGFSLKCVLERHKVFGEIPVGMSRQADYVTIVPKEKLFAFLPKEADVERDIEYNVITEESILEAPVSQGKEVGRVQVFYEGELLGETQLVTNNAVSKSIVLELGGFFKRFSRNPLTIIFIILLPLCVAAGILYRSHTEWVFIQERNEQKREKGKQTSIERNQDIQKRG